MTDEAKEKFLSEERLGVLADSMPHIVWTADASGVREYCNQQTYLYVGSGSGSNDWDWASAVHKDDLEASIVAWRHAIQTGETYQVEQRLRRADGEYRWHLIRGVAIRDRDGRVVRWIGTATDIHDQKMTQQALEQSKHKIAEILDSIQDGFFVLDRDWRFTYLNRRAAGNVGFEPADLIGKNLWEHFPELPGTDSEAAYRRAMEQRAVQRFEMRGIRTHKSYDITVYPSAEGISVYWQDITERKLAEVALRESEQISRRQLGEIEAIYDSAYVGLCVLDRDLRYVRINEHLAEMNGIPRAEHLGRTPREIVPGVADAVEELAVQVIRTGEPVVGVEISGITPALSGVEQCWAEDMLPLKDEEGQVIGINVVVHEITERKRAEGALRRSETFYRAIARYLPDGAVYVLDQDLRFLVAEGPLMARIGQAKEKFEGRRLCEVYDEQMVRAEEAHWRRALSGKTDAYEVEYRGRVLLTKYVPLHDESGRVFAAMALALDTTERRQAEEAVRESEALLRAVMEGATDPIFVKDCESRMLMANPATERVTGMPIATMLGKNDAEIYPDPETGRAIMENDRRIMDGGCAEEVEEIAMTPEGRRIFLSAKTPWRNVEGRVIGLIGMSRDITERKSAEKALRESEERYRGLTEELREADRHKNEFMAILSHELRNPLASIQNGLHIMDRAVPGGEQARRAKDVIDRQVAQLTHLVDDLLDVTRITQNKIKLQQGRIELNDLVRRALDDHRSIFDQHEVRLEAVFSPNPLIVNADAARLAQVIGNLLQNAVKFTHRDGRVSVSVASEQGGRAIVRVADTGVGMSPEVLPRLFQPFMQADTTLDRSRGGLGLGLALSKGLVELHGGEISAHSAGINKGSEFTVFLPLDQTKAEEVRQTKEKVPRHGRRVLIIEDNIDLAESLRELLEFDGHEVAVAYSGVEGLAKACETLPEILLCDIGLPGMDGYAVARAFRADEVLKEVYLVALTGYALPEDLQQAAEAGFDRHLAKPPDMATLERMLAEVPGNGSAG